MNNNNNNNYKSSKNNKISWYNMGKLMIKLNVIAVSLHGTTLPTFTGLLPRSEKKLPTLAKPRWVVFPSSNFQVSRPKIEI